MKENPELSLILYALQNQADTTVLTPGQAINWRLFYKLVLRHRVWHQVYNTFKQYQTDIPVIAALDNHCQNDKRRILITAGETVRIAREFTKRNIEHCFVKGTLLNVHIYGDLYARPCRDIDVWVNVDTYSDAVTALMSLGYQKKLPNYELKDFKERWYMRHKHDMAFYHPEQNILVELHFRLGYLGMDFFPISEVTRTPIKLLNVPVMAPDDDYHVLYLMLHGAIHAWIRLRWLQDIALYIGNNQCDLMRVYDLAKQINCQHIVEQTLILVNDFFKLDNPVLTEFIQKPTHRGTRLATIAHQFIATDYEMIERTKNINMFVKYRIYLARLAVREQKLHAVLGDLFKIDELFVSVTFPNKLSFMYYVIYPLWVIKFIVKGMVPAK